VELYQRVLESPRERHAGARARPAQDAWKALI